MPKILFEAVATFKKYFSKSLTALNNNYQIIIWSRKVLL